MSRRHIVAYWVTTALVVFELVLGGAWDVLRVPQVRGLIERLGYPPYFLVIRKRSSNPSVLHRKTVLNLEHECKAVRRRTASAEPCRG